MKPVSRIDMLFIHGRPGSGKSKQVEFLKSKHPNLFVIYPGEILRRALNPNTEEYYRFNRFVSAYASNIARGELSPPPEDFFQIITPIVTEAIASGNRQLVFDGFPRGISYLEKFDQLIQSLRKEGETRTHHIYLATPESTGAMNISSRKETKERIDDTTSDIEKRMQVFRTETFPMLREFYNRGELSIIRSDRNHEIVKNVIEQKVNDFLIY